MAKAKKLPSGNWRVQVFIGYKTDDSGNLLLNKKGKRIPEYDSITHPLKEEAELLASRFKRERKVNGTPSMLTVRQGIKKYIEARTNILSPSTIQGYDCILRNNIQDIMEIQINELTQAEIQSAINKEALTHEPKTIHNIHGLLVAMLGVYRPGFILNTSLPQLIKRFKELPLPEKIFRAIKDTPIELAAMLAMWLSFSASEIRGIMKTDIKDGILTLSRVIIDVDNKPFVKDVMKEYERARRHVVPPYILQLIDKCDGMYIVPMSAGAIDYWWAKVRDAAGLPPITFHDLRHVNASVMHLLGVPDKYAMERGGWKTDATMKAVYQNVFSDERKEVDRKVDAYFEDIINSV